MRNQSRVVVVFALALATQFAAVAQELTLNEFAQRMEVFGVPDVSTAAYVNVSYCREPEIGNPLPYSWNASGNGWLISEEDTDSGMPVRGSIVINGCDTTDFDWIETISYRQMRSRDLSLPSGEPKPYRCRWGKANWRWDARKAIRFLNLPSAQHSGYELRNGMGGRLALFALALKQRGAQEEAEAIWTGLAAWEATAVHPRTDIMTESMNLVADGQYRKLYRTFRETHDWMAYRDGLQALLARYPDGWRMRFVMERLLTQVEERVATSTPVVPPRDQMEESDAMQARQILGFRGLRGNSGHYADAPAFWLVPSEWQDRAPHPLDAELQIRIRGLEGVPFLLSLGDDETLTDADRASVVRGSAYSSRFSSDALGEAPTDAVSKRRVLEAYDQLERPATRGEMALRLAMDVVPEWILDNPYGKKSAGELVGIIQEFCREHAKDSGDELAVWSLPGRYPFAYTEFAKDYLLAHARQERIPALEEFLLGKGVKVTEDRESDRNLARRARMDLLIRYAFLRGEEARPLLREFAKQLRKIDESELADSLAALPLDESLVELAARVPKGEYASDNFDRKVLIARVETLPPEEALGGVLVAAVVETNAEARRNLLRYLQWRVKRTPFESCRATAHRELWETLLADDRPEVLQTCLVLNEQLFAILEKDVYPSEDYEPDEYNREARTASQFLKVQGKRGREWLRGRVSQRLAGVPERDLPRYPDNTPPGEMSLATLKDRFAAVEERSAASNIVGALSLPEYIALPNMLLHEPALNARLASMANQIDRVVVVGDAGEWGERFSAWEGKGFSPELLKEMRQCVEKMAQARTPATCRLVRSGDFGGCEMGVEIGSTNTGVVAGFAGMACAPGVYGAAVWRTAVPPDKEHFWRAVKTSSPHTQAQFQKAMERIFDSAPPACGEAIMAFQTQGDGT